MTALLEDIEQANPSPITVSRTDLLDALKQYWGFDDFRALQLESIEAVLTAQDSITLFPTGGGKSLCYQLPILFFPKSTALIISPLISLMEDQVQQAKSKGFSVGCLNSSQSPEERRDIFQRYQNGDLQLLYVSPEKMANPQFLDALQAHGRLAYIAIDEAHCISQWGHQFRPDYQKLGGLRDAFPHLAIHAFTATAPRPVVQDIETSLKLKEAERFQSSMFRANLQYKVAQRSGRLGDFLQEQVLPILQSRKGQAGIIYCLSRKDVEDLALALQVNGINAKAYHAGLPDALRSQNQDAFMQGKVNIMVATTAFGMGIDRADIRFVIHASMPQSLEGYVQEAGRAGRDGLPATCYLFKRAGDERSWTNMLTKSGESTQRLWNMLMYTDSNACRHQQILDHFGQSLKSKRCTGCDVCQTRPAVYENSALLMKHTFSVIHRLKDHATPDTVVGALYGDLAPVAMGHRELVQALPSFGSFKKEGAFRISLYLEQLERLNFISLPHHAGQTEAYKLESKAIKWLKSSDFALDETPLMRAEDAIPLPTLADSIDRLPKLILPNARPKPPRKPRKRQPRTPTF